MSYRDNPMHVQRADNAPPGSGPMLLKGALALFGAGLLAALVVYSFVVSPTEARAQGGCDRFAATNGNNNAPGTQQRPFRTVQKLANSLNPGQTGCLRGGVYGAANAQLSIRERGITLRSAPRQRAEIRARIHVARGANGVTVRNLNLNGAPHNLPSVTVNAHSTRWLANDVTNHHRAESCFVLGSYGFGRADNTLISNNRIHDCGRMPRSNHDHGIYVGLADDTRIFHNTIFSNADRGIQLYPDADRTRIRNNVIDGNGQGIIFSGDNGVASHSNRVIGNTITNAEARHNLESFYPDGNPIGRNNVARENCVRGGARDSGNGGIQSPQRGFSVNSNVIQFPSYVNRSNGNFRIQNGNCRELMLNPNVRSRTPFPGATG